MPQPRPFGMGWGRAFLLRHRLGLSARIVLFALALAIAPLLLFGLSTLTETEAELKSAVNERVLATARGLMDRIRLVVEPTRTALVLLRDAVDDPRVPPDGKLAMLEGSLRGLPAVRALRVSVAGQSPIFLFERSFKASLDHLRPDLETLLASVEPPASGASPWQVRTSAPLRIEALDRWLLPLHIQFRAPLNERRASLLAYLDVTDLIRQLGREGFDHPGGVWVLDETGAPVFPSRSEPGTGPPLLVGDMPDLQSSGPGTLLATPFEGADGTSMLGAFAVLDFPPWVLLVGAPERQAYGLAQRVREHLLWWLVLSACVGLVGALILSRRVGRPIREMAVVAERVGGGDLGARVGHVSRDDEIGLLGERLDWMIGELEQGHRQLDMLAHQDPLTGLPNRRSVLQYLQRVLPELDGETDSVAVFFLDLDRFKRVNDSLGHGVGDELLRLAARRLSEKLGEDEWAARLAGDEFLVIRRGAADREAISRVAMRLIGAFSAPFYLADVELQLGSSIGIAVAPCNGIEVTELITNADMAMYRAKELGRGQYHFFDAELKTCAVRKLRLDVRLRRAFERGELEVYYQPQVDIDSHRILAAEALLRWPDGEGRFVASPGEFIPLAEETGLILPLGDWVMEAVCAQISAWLLRGAPPVTVSVNVSSLQFRRSDYVGRVCSALDRSALNARHLGLELTESLLLDDVDLAIGRMEQLKEMGVQLMIDDFGTGYSSLAYLRRFPLDYLKVAQEFVAGIETNRHDAMIVGAVIALSKSLGLNIIAEGVETAGQLAYLSERRCDLIQGYYFARPLRADDFVALLERGPIQTPAFPVRLGA
ncbi:putative bifunctional diguanylate cyclase/phosphodiesterase [Thiorhodococcus drewsii]|uniref:putative bifunctional diguanylate cyclase/phosphodiesterase n=1 Tax=Thiorhodococcus drewsii TaxID=210408 RepID=UPI00131F1209|nr:EAL domain-containing protein [Thiorhodococcus drewsii]